MFLFSITYNYGQGYTRTYGAYANDVGNAVRQVHDSGFVIAGTTSSFGFGSSDVYLIKAGLNGDLEWSKTYGGAQIDQGIDIKQTLDSGLVIVGFTNSFGAGGYDVYLIRTDRFGTVLWEKTFGGPDWDFGHKVLVLDDGGFVVVGDTYSYGQGNSDIYLIRTDQNGDTLWTRTYGGVFDDLGRSVKITDDGGMIIAGGYGHSSINMDAWLLKTNAIGDTTWTTMVGGDSLELARDVVQTFDLGYSGLGITESLSEWTEMYQFKTDPMGNVVWEENWGQPYDREGYELLLRADGGFITGGYTRGIGGGGIDFFTQRVDQYGNYEGGRTNGGSNDDVGYSIDTTFSGEIVMVGTTEGAGFGQLDVMLILADSTGDTGGSSWVSIFDPLLINELGISEQNIVVYPNPFIDGTYIEMRSESQGAIEWSVEIFDIVGRPIWNSIQKNAKRVWFDPQDLKDGVYFYQIEIDHVLVDSGKLILQH